MAIGTSINIAAPAAAAAVSLYFFNKDHANTKDVGGTLQASLVKLAAKLKQDMDNTKTPKLAPQFDGLCSFETLIN